MTRRTAVWLVTGIIAVIMALFLNAALSAARAQGVCMAHATMVDQLNERFSEVPVAIGLVGANAMVEVFADADGSSWTLIITKPDGTSCVIIAGEAWQMMEHDRKWSL